MRKIKEFKIFLSDQDAIDVKIMIERSKVVGFVLNLRCIFNYFMKRIRQSYRRFRKYYEKSIRK